MTEHSDAQAKQRVQEPYDWPEEPFLWVEVRPLGRNVLPGDVLPFGQVLTIEADPSRNTVTCAYSADGETKYSGIAGDRRVDALRPIPRIMPPGA